jgi:hypothetical protein
VKTKKLIKKLIQSPLRFHHQDIHEELQDIVSILGGIQSTLDNITERLDQLDKLGNYPRDSTRK